MIPPPPPGAPVTLESVAATDAARRLWARAVGPTSAPGEVAAAAERVCTQLRKGLSRWVGVGGYNVLIDRALGMVRQEHPAIADLACRGEDQPVRRSAGRPHGAGETAAGVVALVTTLIELLGRIVGAEMAVRLVEQTGIPGPRAVVSTEKRRARDG